MYLPVAGYFHTKYDRKIKACFLYQFSIPETRKILETRKLQIILITYIILM